VSEYERKLAELYVVPDNLNVRAPFGPRPAVPLPASPQLPNRPAVQVKPAANSATSAGILSNSILSGIPEGTDVLHTLRLLGRARWAVQRACAALQWTWALTRVSVTLKTPKQPKPSSWQNAPRNATNKGDTPRASSITPAHAVSMHRSPSRGCFPPSTGNCGPSHPALRTSPAAPRRSLDAQFLGGVLHGHVYD
jgi:hypothetical protein